MKTALPNWTGDTVVILAAGPSLREFVREGSLPAGVRTIAVNSSVFAMPAADVCFALDFMWWKTHYQAVRQTKAQPWTTDRGAAERFGLLFARGANDAGLGATRVHSNGNSGAGAINFAVLAGAKRILLLGFDMKLGPAGERHWHPDHPKPCVQAQCFDDWLYKFGPIARDAEKLGVEILNCTPGSALTAFPMTTLKEALCPAL